MKKFKGGSFLPRLSSIEFARYFVFEAFPENRRQNQNVEYGKENNEKVSQSANFPNAGTLHMRICGTRAITLVKTSDTK